MKTFDEAIGLFLRKGSINDTPEEAKVHVEALENSVSRFHETIEEVQLNPETYIMSAGLIQYGVANCISLNDLLVTAIAHGVAIGIEMEKIDVSTELC